MVLERLGAVWRVAFVFDDAPVFDLVMDIFLTGPV